MTSDSPPPQPHITPGPTTAMSFAMLIETACEQYEYMQQLIERELAVVFVDRTNARTEEHHRAHSCIIMALGKSFLFNIVRARRICEHCADKISLSRADRKLFLKLTEQIVDTRDINEHGFDGRLNSPKPSLHNHDGLYALDETSMIILGPDKILMGPLNLATIYPHVKKLQNVAGFRSLRTQGKLP